MIGLLSDTKKRKMKSCLLEVPASSSRRDFLKVLPKESISSHLLYIFAINLGFSNTLLKECNSKISEQLVSYYFLAFGRGDDNYVKHICV